MMNGGILQGLGNFRQIHIALPDHLFALLQLDPADILAGRDLQVLMKQRSQITGADFGVLCHQRHTQPALDMGADVLLRAADDLIFVGNAVGTPGLLGR